MNKLKKMWATAVLCALGTVSAFAQSGVNGLNTATSTLKTYIAPVTTITLVIGGIVGIIGAIRVYSKWNSGDQDINKELMESTGCNSETDHFYGLDLMHLRK